MKHLDVSFRLSDYQNPSIGYAVTIINEADGEVLHFVGRDSITGVNLLTPFDCVKEINNYLVGNV